ncbi:MAG: hypothetical protein MZU84_00590 [Sphingobacterium sp.]|nr:hypothetical protein [Sphingobacterium sp.]
MPKTDEILNGLQKIVNDYSLVAIIWHLVFYALLAALLFKWLPTNRDIRTADLYPCAFGCHTGFHVGESVQRDAFSILAVLGVIFGLKATGQPVQTSQLVFMIIGILMIVFGLVYPHFIDAGSIVKYLYASPAGLIPCPTLSVIIGFLLLYNGFGSQSITLTLIVFGLFYGIFGVLRLGVYLDIFLVFEVFRFWSNTLLP